MNGLYIIYYRCPLRISISNKKPSLNVFFFAFKNDAMFDTISTLGSLLQDQVVKASRIINLRLYRSSHRDVLDFLDFHVLKPSTVQYFFCGKFRPGRLVETIEYSVPISQRFLVYVSLLHEKFLV